VRKNLNEIGTVFVAVAQIIAGIVCAWNNFLFFFSIPHLNSTVDGLSSLLYMAYIVQLIVQVSKE
jgi:hypothetical protein